MPYDTHGGGHRGELRLYCPRTKVKFSKMTCGAHRHKSSRKISLPSEDNIRAQCLAPFALCRCAPLDISENFTSVLGQYKRNSPLCPPPCLSYGIICHCNVTSVGCKYWTFKSDFFWRSLTKKSFLTYNFVPGYKLVYLY